MYNGFSYLTGIEWSSWRFLNGYYIRWGNGWLWS